MTNVQKIVNKQNMTITQHDNVAVEITEKLDNMLPARTRRSLTLNNIEVEKWLTMLNKDTNSDRGNETFVIIDSNFFNSIVKRAGIKVNFGDLVSGIPGARIAQYFTPSPPYTQQSSALRNFIGHLQAIDNIKVVQRRIHFGQEDIKLGSMVTDIFISLLENVLLKDTNINHIVIFSKEVDLVPIITHIKNMQSYKKFELTLFESKYAQAHTNLLSKADYVVDVENLLSKLECYYTA